MIRFVHDLFSFFSSLSGAVVSPGDIAERARRIRLTVRELTRKAGCGENTAQRTLSLRTDPRHSTLVALEDAVVTEELRLRDYLVALHPLEARRQDEAA